MIPKRLRAKRGEEFLSCSILESLEIGSLAIPWVHKSLFARVVKWESSKRALITRPAAASEAVEEAVSIFLVIGEFVSLYVRKICILLRPYEIFGWLLPACLSAQHYYCQSGPCSGRFFWWRHQAVAHTEFALKRHHHHDAALSVLFSIMKAFLWNLVRPLEGAVDNEIDRKSVVRERV